jgi:hypothetical protein
MTKSRGQYDGLKTAVLIERGTLHGCDLAKDSGRDFALGSQDEHLIRENGPRNEVDDRLECDAERKRLAHAILASDALRTHKLPIDTLVTLGFYATENSSILGT